MRLIATRYVPSTRSVWGPDRIPRKIGRWTRGDRCAVLGPTCPI